MSLILLLVTFFLGVSVGLGVAMIRPQWIIRGVLSFKNPVKELTQFNDYRRDYR